MTRTILILSANPKGTPQLRLDQEVREIENGLERARKREEFVLRQKWAVRSLDVRRAMLDYNPNIVHFCGHGAGEEGIFLEDENGQAKSVSAEALASFFRLFADQVECIVLNACYSEVQAKAIAKDIPYVIGMEKAIGDEAAIEFAVAFYDSLATGRTIEFSYKIACAAIPLAGLGEKSPSVLNSRVHLLKSNKLPKVGSNQEDQIFDTEPLSSDLSSKAMDFSFGHQRDVINMSALRVAQKYSSLVKDNVITFLSDIPEEKLNNAYANFANLAIVENETPLCLIDNTVFGNGGKGCLITDYAIYYKNNFDRGRVALTDITSAKSKGFLNAIVINKKAHKIFTLNKKAKIEMEQGSAKGLKLIVLMILELAKIQGAVISD